MVRRQSIGESFHVKLEATRKYRLNAGEVGVYADGAIHSIDYPPKSRFIRITGTNLDKIYRDSFDPVCMIRHPSGPGPARAFRWRRTTW